MLRLLPVLCLAVAVAVGACGGGETGSSITESLSPDGQAGRRLFLEKGCAGCHGRNGEGIVGPALAGQWGTTVSLRGGGTVVFDEEWVATSIREPAAARRAGSGANAMPAYDLPDDEVRLLTAYIRELGSSAAPAGR